MTETQWLAAGDARQMLEFVWDKVSARKMRCFANACCRRIWHLMPDDRSRTAVEVSERFADGEASRQELSRAQHAIRGIVLYEAHQGAGTAASSAARHAAGVQRFYSTHHAAADACWASRLAVDFLVGAGEAALQAALLRDIVGPAPYRHLPVVSAAILHWNDGCIVKLATGVYQERDDAEMLDHCRGPGPHARGCWVADLLLGKR